MDNANVAESALKLLDYINIAILIVTIIAIIVGPIIAVCITRYFDDRREHRRRKFDIFHSLMRTRSMTFHPDHIMALNLIQVEFHKNDKVVQAYTTYLPLFKQQSISDDAELPNNFSEQIENALFNLISEIGKDLGHNYDKMELKNLSHGVPEWLEDDQTVKSVWKMLKKLLDGEGELPVKLKLSLDQQSNENEEPQHRNRKHPPSPNTNVLHLGSIDIEEIADKYLQKIKPRKKGSSDDT